MVVGEAAADSQEVFVLVVFVVDAATANQIRHSMTILSLSPERLRRPDRRGDLARRIRAKRPVSLRNFHEAPGCIGEHVDSPYSPNDKTLVRIATVEIPGGRRFFDTQVTFGRRPLLIETIANLGVEARRQLLTVDRADGNEHRAEKQRISRGNAEAQGARDPAELFDARHVTPAVRPLARPASR